MEHEAQETQSAMANASVPRSLTQDSRDAHAPMHRRWLRCEILL